MVAKRKCSSQSRLLLMGASALGCATVWAAGGAHEHGAAELFLSAEGTDVQISVNLPAQSIVGFETTAISAEQKSAVESVQASLMLPNTLFTLGENACTLVTANVDVSSIMGMSNAHSRTEEHADHHDEADHTGHDKVEIHADHHEEQEEAARHLAAQAEAAAERVRLLELAAAEERRADAAWRALHEEQRRRLAEAEVRQLLLLI